MNNIIYIFAGPCSIDKNNIKDIYDIANIKINNTPAIFGTRVVGLKSRTILNDKGDGMGIDYNTLVYNQDILIKGGSFDDLKTPRSITITKQIIRDTNLVVSTEIMMPTLQLPPMLRELPDRKVMLWNPSVNQLGWQILQMSKFAKEKKWFLGIKNGKWVGIEEKIAEQGNQGLETPIEKTWKGLLSYTNSNIDQNKVFFIHRGFETENKGEFRAKPLHMLAKRVKNETNTKMLFDPSHSLGVNLRDKIVSETLKAMKIKIDKNTYLYDGILIEVGKSKTDTHQHIQIHELEELVYNLSQFRRIKTRE